jgi:hypothetical protein
VGFLLSGILSFILSNYARQFYWKPRLKEKPFMLKKRYYIFILSCLYCMQLHAQDDADTAKYEIDTTISEPADETLIDVIEGKPVEKDTGFDTVSYADKQPVLERRLKDTTVSELRSDEAFWYVNEKPKRAEPKSPKIDKSKGIFEKEWFRNIMWLLIVGGFLAVLIWFILSSDIQLFKKRPRSIQKKEDDLENQSIFDISFDTELQKALSAKDYRSGYPFILPANAPQPVGTGNHTIQSGSNQ